MVSDRVILPEIFFWVDLSACKYDYIGDFDGNNEAVFYFMGYPGTLSISGKESCSAIKMLFDRVYQMDSESEFKEKLDGYMSVIAFDEVCEGGYAGACYNNMGVMYEDVAEDRDTALAYYSQSNTLGDETGRSNYKRLKGVISSEKWMAIGNALMQAGQQLSGASEGNGNHFSNEDSAPASGGVVLAGEGSSTNFQMLYNNWERRAESHYNSLTNLGIRIEDSLGRKGGTSGGTGGMSSSNYTRMKQLLREAQQNMQKIRRDAAKEGVSIAQSRWETATVSY